MTLPADELVERLRKRADQIGALLSDPPRPHPDAALMREAAAEISSLRAKLAEAMEVVRQILRLFDEQGNLAADFPQIQAALEDGYQVLSRGTRRLIEGNGNECL